jgi:acetyl-CoA synthetase
MEADSPNPDRAAFLAARDFLLTHRTDQVGAVRHFRWPALERFNWALDHFDVLAQGNGQPALWIVNEDGSEQKRSFLQMSERSSQVANFLRQHGVKRGDASWSSSATSSPCGKACSAPSNWVPW